MYWKGAESHNIFMTVVKLTKRKPVFKISKLKAPPIGQKYFGGAESHEAYAAHGAYAAKTHRTVERSYK